MTITRLHSDKWMTQIVIHHGTVYLSGQVDLNEPAAPTVKEQTVRILARIDQLLSEAGSSKDFLLSASIWLADISHFSEMNEVWEAWLGHSAAPARATVEARLARPQFLVEISITAALTAGEQKTDD